MLEEAKPFVKWAGGKRQILDGKKSNKSNYIVMQILDGSLRKSFLAGKEINDNPDFIENTRTCSSEEILVLCNTKTNRKAITKLASMVRVKSN